ncbi:MAG: LysR family transcriptional regulator, partial [Nannocystaceae bacterium]
MDWGTVSFDWNRARAFLVTAEEGSFSAAGRALGLGQPTIGRQVAALEQELDVLLFERVGHSLELTATGLDLLEHVRTMGEGASRVSLVAAGQSLSLEGSVCISASQITAIFSLPEIVTGLRADYPGIEIEIVATNETSDLSRREADIALRFVRTSRGDLVSKRVAHLSNGVWGHPRWQGRAWDELEWVGLDTNSGMYFGTAWIHEHATRTPRVTT